MISTNRLLGEIEWNRKPQQEPTVVERKPEIGNRKPESGIVRSVFFPLYLEWSSRTSCLSHDMWRFKRCLGFTSAPLSLLSNDMNTLGKVAIHITFHLNPARNMVLKHEVRRRFLTNDIFIFSLFSLLISGILKYFGRNLFFSMLNSKKKNNS